MTRGQEVALEQHMNAVLDIDNKATNVPWVSLTVLETINKRNEISSCQMIFY